MAKHYMFGHCFARRIILDGVDGRSACVSLCCALPFCFHWALVLPASFAMA